MVLSAEERKKRKAEAGKKYREKNKDKIKEQKKEYQKENKEKIAEYQKEYRKENKDKIKEQKKEYNKEYKKTSQCIKSNTISQWKKRGLVHPDLDALYETYLQTESCNVCKKVFQDTFERCLDHDHTTGLFRQILCRGCNTKDNWKKKI